MPGLGAHRADPTATLLASDEPLRREGMAALLRQCGPVEIVGECPDAEALLDSTEALSPALIVLDFEIPGPDPVELIPRIRERSAAKILIVAGADDEGIVNHAIEAGASGYLFRRCSSQEFRHAVVNVLRGRLYIQGSCEAANPHSFRRGCEMDSTDPGMGLAKIIEDAILQRFRAVASELETKLEQTHRESIRSCFESVQNTIDARMAALAERSLETDTRWPSCAVRAAELN